MAVGDGVVVEVGGGARGVSPVPRLLADEAGAVAERHAEARHEARLRPQAEDVAGPLVPHLAGGEVDPEPALDRRMMVPGGQLAELRIDEMPGVTGQAALG